MYQIHNLQCKNSTEKLQWMQLSCAPAMERPQALAGEPHAPLSLVAVDDSPSTLRLPNATVALQRNSIYLVDSRNAGVRAALRSQPCRGRAVAFHPQCILSSSQLHQKYIQPVVQRSMPALLVSEAEEPSTRALFNMAFHACQTQTPESHATACYALLQIFLHLAEVPHAPQTDALQDDRLPALLRWIDEHYADPITVAMLAQQANLSVRECERLFQRRLGCTPVCYLRERRLQAAAKLLRETTLSVTEIAISSGFSNPSYFTKQFRLHTGSTPLAYRTAQTVKALPH